MSVMMHGLRMRFNASSSSPPVLNLIPTTLHDYNECIINSSKVCTYQELLCHPRRVREDETSTLGHDFLSRLRAELQRDPLLKSRL